jgi:single-stranded-DNA-specific exonuclease
MKLKKWLLAAVEPAAAQALSRQLGVGRLVSCVLAARGMECVEQAREFLDLSSHGIHDPFLLPDMAAAVAGVEAAIAAGEPIAVYGDYDVDGVTATCVLIQYLRQRGAKCTYYIPDRLGEGYGLNSAAIQSLYDQGCRLLITVDSGITANEEAEYAKQIGMKLIITDHHECKDALPDALAVVNPRREDSTYPFRELAGVGVAFKLVCALERETPIEELLERYADVVAVGTVADVMPLVGENRIIVSRGLENLANTRNLGLRALMQKLGLEGKKVTSNSVSFVMAPRINAAGRLGGASSAARMFLTRDPGEAAELADYLCELNRSRQEEENAIYQQILEYLAENPHLTTGKTMVLWGDDWHNGVIGIVSSRLSDRYGVPCVLISMNGDMGKGSGRSIKGFNLYAALEKNAHLLEKHGGHELAVGLTVHRENLEALRAALEDYARFDQTEEAVPCIQVDCLVEPEDITLEEVQDLTVMEPFGMGNPQPAFLIRRMRIDEITPISHDRHAKFYLSKNGQSFQGIIFGMGAKSCRFVRGDFVDVVFAPEINTYRGNSTVQMVIRDMRWSAEEQQRDESSQACYDAFCREEVLGRERAVELSPTRSDLVAVFRYVRTHAQEGLLTIPLRTLYRRVRYESGGNMNLGRLLVCLDVFAEFDLFNYTITEDEVSIRLPRFEGKADINGSVILKKLTRAREGL